MRRLVVFLIVLAVVVPCSVAWTWPVQGPVLQTFAFDQAHPYAAGQHRGVAIGADSGAPVLAPAAGVVTFAGTVAANGTSLTIETPSGLAVSLTHLGSIAVARDASVAEGSVVGTVGPSGTAEFDVPYVHLGVRDAANDQGYLDPLGFLPVLAAPPPASEPAPVTVAAPVVAPPPAAAAPALVTVPAVPVEPAPVAGPVSIAAPAAPAAEPAAVVTPAPASAPPVADAAPADAVSAAAGAPGGDVVGASSDLVVDVRPHAAGVAATPSAIGAPPAAAFVSLAGPRSAAAAPPLGLVAASSIPSRLAAPSRSTSTLVARLPHPATSPLRASGRLAGEPPHGLRSAVPTIRSSSSLAALSTQPVGLLTSAGSGSRGSLVLGLAAAVLAAVLLVVWLRHRRPPRPAAPVRERLAT